MTAPRSAAANLVRQLSASLRILEGMLDGRGDDREASVELAARLFCELDDDAQATFFCRVAAIAEAEFQGGGPEGQWWRVGNHLRDCRCSTEEGRQVVRTIAEAMAPREEGPP